MAEPSQKCIALLALPFVLSCFPLTDGQPIPLNRIYFPVGLALSDAGERLYVANSDTDLQFNTGSVLVFDTAEIHKRVPQSCATDADCADGWTCKLGSKSSGLCRDSEQTICGDLGTATAGEQAAAPGPCRPLDAATPGLIVASARMAPFATDIAYSVWRDANGRAHPRVFLSVRGDATLTWADVRPGGNEFDCGQQGNPNAECDSAHRQGNDPSEYSPQGAQLPTEPTWLAVGARGGLITMGHKTNGKVSIFENGYDSDPNKDGPRLKYVLGNLGVDPEAMVAVPPSRYAELKGLDKAPGFLVTYTTYSSYQEVPRIDLLRYVTPSRGESYLQGVNQATFGLLQLGTDTRGIALDAGERNRCEQVCEKDQACVGGDSACESCLQDCARVPLDVFAANRTPSSLLIGKTRTSLTEVGTDDVPYFSSVAALRGEPARVISASVIGLNGEAEPRVFTLGYKSRFLYIYNPQTAEIEMQVPTGGGPQGFVVDAKRGLGYVAHQTDSYIGVVDLDRRHATYGEVVLNVGQPTPPHSSK